MNKKIVLSLFIFNSLQPMEKPFERLGQFLARVSPRKKATEPSPRTDSSDEKVTVNPLKKEPSPRNTEISSQDCLALEHLAVEIDLLYRNSKEIIAVERVENAYIKALNCFVTTFETDKHNIRLHLQKLHALFLQIESEKKQQNPVAYVMAEHVKTLNTKVYDVIKSKINEGSHE
jgi:hypothetical protein